MDVLIDPAVDSIELLTLLYGGALVVLTSLGAVSRLVEFTRRELVNLFDGQDPLTAHERESPDDLAARLGRWKPRYLRDPDVNRLVRETIEEAGFDPTRTHYDMPKPRTSFPHGSLTTGIAYAFPWHRDTWYGAPPPQINWWLPIYPVASDNAMAFDPCGFGQSVPNDSDGFDYYSINIARASTATQIGKEIQSRPRAIDHETASDVVLLPDPGSVILFSGDQLHRSIPNTSGVSRYSVDFRTVDSVDLAHRRGAPLVDVDCTGTAVRDFRNVADGSTFSESFVTGIFGAPPPGAVLTFEPT